MVKESLASLSGSKRNESLILEVRHNMSSDESFVVVWTFWVRMEFDVDLRRRTETNGLSFW